MAHPPKKSPSKTKAARKKATTAEAPNRAADDEGAGAVNSADGGGRKPASGGSKAGVTTRTEGGAKKVPSGGPAVDVTTSAKGGGHRTDIPGGGGGATAQASTMDAGNKTPAGSGVVGESGPAHGGGTTKTQHRPNDGEEGHRAALDFEMADAELLRLPPWTMVTLVARCAMRMQPFVCPSVYVAEASGPAKGSTHVRSIEAAISCAVMCATGRVDTARAKVAIRAARIASSAAYVRAIHLQALADQHPVISPTAVKVMDAANAARAAISAATAAIYATEATSDDAYEADKRAAAMHAVDVTNAATSAALAATRSDYDQLLSRNVEGVEADLRAFLELPLWPNGEPDGWRANVVNPWVNELRELADEDDQSELADIATSYIRLLDGRGFDF